MKTRQVVMTIGLAKYLLGQGFSIIDLDFSKRGTNTAVFIFSYSEELQSAMDTYFAQQKYKKEHTA
jgi:hypothetical protein